MMDENKKTLAFVAAAVVLAVLAFIVAPKRITSDAFSDQGQEFYPDFDDPNTAQTLEVIQYDSESGAAVPFKVTFKNGLWTIPSHHDYPADAADHLAQAAAGFIGIKRDDFRSDNLADHASFGVVDPLDEAAGLTGRGTRVTIRGASDDVLVDYIVGHEVDGRPGFRFIRLPGSSRVYAARVDVDVSTRFEDWIETDLLQVAKHRIAQIELRDYSIIEGRGGASIDQRDVITLTKQDDDTWKMGRLPSGRQLDSTVVEEMLSTLDSLTIVGVRPKPAGLTATLRQIEGETEMTNEDLRSLQGKGFYLARDGRLLSNEGELQVLTKDGVLYTLRFGEVVYGRGDAVSAGLGADTPDQGAGENRYLFISAQFEPGYFPEPPMPSDTSYVGKADSLLTETDKANKERNRVHNTWQRSVSNGQQKAQELNDRFAEWYYVISAESFDSLHRTRKEMLAP